jgi:DNA-binding Xre family transcriptional regulator
MSTAKDTLATDNGQTPDQDLGMALYLDEWMTYKRVRNVDLARALGCDRSLVGLWRKKARPLTNINWINGICEFLDISPGQLAKMPPKGQELLASSKGVRSDTEPSAKEAESTEGIEMIEKRTDLHAAIDDLPDHLVPTAQRLVDRLMGLRGPTPPHPTKRGSTKG